MFILMSQKYSRAFRTNLLPKPTSSLTSVVNPASSIVQAAFGSELASHARIAIGVAGLPYKPSMALSEPVGRSVVLMGNHTRRTLGSEQQFEVGANRKHKHPHDCRSFVSLLLNENTAQPD